VVIAGGDSAAAVGRGERRSEGRAAGVEMGCMHHGLGRRLGR
jgi:hypothetical protein